MRPENNSFKKAAKLARKDGKPEPIRHSELRSPEGSNQVQAVNSYDARERSSQNHEADGALKHSHAQLDDSSRIKARPEISANDRADGVPIHRSGDSAQSAPEIKKHDWRSRGYAEGDELSKPYKQNSDKNQPSVKPSRKASL